MSALSLKVALDFETHDSANMLAANGPTTSPIKPWGDARTDTRDNLPIPHTSYQLLSPLNKCNMGPRKSSLARSSCHTKKPLQFDPLLHLIREGGGGSTTGGS
jgi:hypothetical protein